MGTSESRQCRIARVRAVTDDLPSKPGTYPSQGVWLGVTKHDEVLRVDGDHKISIVAVTNEQMRTPKGLRHVLLVSGAARDLP
jgi:hypothetical protein